MSYSCLVPPYLLMETCLFSTKWKYLILKRVWTDRGGKTWHQPWHFTKIIFARRPFSNIDEDIDDIECDNPECPEEIQELKQEILSAYQVGWIVFISHQTHGNILTLATEKYVWNTETKREAETKLQRLPRYDQLLGGASSQPCQSWSAPLCDAGTEGAPPWYPQERSQGILPGLWNRC